MWTQLTTIKKVKIEVNGVEVEVDVDIPIEIISRCENCGGSVGYSIETDQSGDIIQYIEKCKCEVE